MSVYIGDFKKKFSEQVREGVSRLESGDALQFFGFENDAVLKNYYEAACLLFPGYERKNLVFSKSPRINIWPERYLMIRKK